MSEPTHQGHDGAVPYDCETIVRRLWDYVDGRLPNAPRAEVEAHLAACVLCPPHFAFARHLRESIRASAPVTSDDDESRLRERVRRALEAAARPTRPARRTDDATGAE